MLLKSKLKSKKIKKQIFEIKGIENFKEIKEDNDSSQRRANLKILN